MPYYKEMTAAYCDCDQNNRLKLSGMLRYMQQTSSEQLESIGLSPEKLYHENFVFLLSKTNIRVSRPPMCTEKLRVGTAAVPVRGARFLREFTIDSIGGERLVSCLSLWVLTDTVSHKILRPPAFPYPLPIEAPSLEGIIGDLPIIKEKELSPGMPRSRIEIPVRYSHLDINAHVNNSYYADFVCDAVPHKVISGRRVEDLALSFALEARHGDMIEAEAVEFEENAYRVAATHGRGLCMEAQLRFWTEL